MFIKINNKKIEIFELIDFKNRFKSLKFVIEPIKYGVVLPKRKLVNTYWFCQRVDCCICDKDFKIIKMYERLKSEKIRFIRKGYYIYFLPLNSINNLKIGDTLKYKK